MVSPKDTIRLYWQHARVYKERLLAIGLLTTFAIICQQVLSAYFVSRILDKLIRPDVGSMKDYRVWLIAILIALIAEIIFWRVQVWILWIFENFMYRDLYRTVFKHFMNLDTAFFNNRFSGQLVSQAGKFVGGFETLFDILAFDLLTGTVFLISTVIIVTSRVPFYGLFIVVFTMLYLYAMWRLRRKQITFNTREAQADSRVTAQVADVIGNIATVKATAKESKEKRLFQKVVNQRVSRSLELRTVTTKADFASHSMTAAISLIGIVVSVWAVVNKLASPGTVVLLYSYTANLCRRLWDASNIMRRVTRTFGDAHDMTEILNTPPALSDVPGAKKLALNKGLITFESVDFHYGDTERKKDVLFNKLNLHIYPGEKVGLVGPSGGGKTTITKLLLRFMDINGGHIAIDGQSIAEVTQESLRDAIAYVPQEPLLFHRSLKENISYGRDDATDEEIIKAAKQANAHEFIEKLAEGYETLVGERGVKLSGGQRQRVAIARALLKNSPILVLDEATSALDSESEKLIQDALWNLMEGRTAIVIAHRLSTIQHMDRIIVLKNGAVAEQGSHKELLSNGGTYAGLWNHQSGGFMED